MARSGWNTIALLQNMGQSLGGALSSLGAQRQQAEFQAEQRRRQAEEDKRRQEAFDLQIDKAKLSIPGATGEDIARNDQRRPDNPTMIKQRRNLPGGGIEERDIPANRLRQFGNVLDTEEQSRQRMMGPSPEFYSPEVRAQMEKGQAEKNARVAAQKFAESVAGRKLAAREKEIATRLEQEQEQKKREYMLSLLGKIGNQLQNIRNIEFGTPENSAEFNQLQGIYNDLVTQLYPQQEVGAPQQQNESFDLPGFLKRLFLPGMN